MVDGEPTPHERFVERVSDFGPVTVTPGDYTTSPEALRVLREHGVGAWRRWCREHQPAEPTPAVQPFD